MALNPHKGTDNSDFASIRTSLVYFPHRLAGVWYGTIHTLYMYVHFPFPSCSCDSCKVHRCHDYSVHLFYCGIAYLVLVPAKSSELPEAHNKL
jgi:hypothetical protein